MQNFAPDLESIRTPADKLIAIKEGAKAKPTQVAIMFIALIVAFSFGLSFYFQSVTEDNIRRTLFEEQRARQFETTESLTRQVGSELDSILGRLQGIANSNYIQQGELSGDRIHELLRENHIPLESSVKSLFIVDRSDVETATSLADYQNYAGLDHSGKEYAVETKVTMGPVFTRSFAGADGELYVVASYPIIQRETGEYLGMVGASIPVKQFFGHYGNVYDINADHIEVTDKAGTYILAGDPSIVGKSSRSQDIQQRIDKSADYDELYRAALAGSAGSLVFRGPSGEERLEVVYPVALRGDTVLTVAVGSPTAGTYSKIENIVFTQRLQTFTLLTAIVAAIAVMVYFLARWSEALRKEVKVRTAELQETNEKLKKHDKLQREFINIAAHELRTPVQPLLGMADILNSNFEQKGGKVEITQPELELIIRNARRLERLSSDILEVSRIESDSLKLNKETADLNRKIDNVIKDAKSSLLRSRDKVRIVHEQAAAAISGPLLVSCDRSRIFEVLSNLIANAVKFTEKGTITVRSEKKDGYAVVSVSDTGTGIDPKIMPRLFTKFATSSDQGTGLGLFISKNIIEAHGGKIWAENNPGGKGATFSFTLPLEG
jgi:signal transduction histidine kinase